MGDSTGNKMIVLLILSLRCLSSRIIVVSAVRGFGRVVSAGSFRPTYVYLNLNLNLNLNSLLVKRQIDNPSPGAVTGGN